MSDLINRDDAIMAVKVGALSAATIYGRTDEGSTALYETVRAIKAIPSAQPMWKKGKWIYAEDEYGIDGYHCDKCGFFVPWDYAHTFINYIEDYNFCPSCGADMRGEEDDTCAIKALPSAQPEIIRCRECKHYQFADNRAFGMPVKMCEWFGFEDVDDDDFCSRAERRQDE